MATTVQIIKTGRLEAVVKVTGTGTATIALSSLKKADETLGTPLVNVHALKWTTGTTGVIAITRNSQPLYSLQMTGEFVLDSSNDSTNQGSDFAVDMGTAPATLILYLKKMAGYQEPDQQHAP